MNAGAVAVKVIGVTVRTPNAKATSLARAWVGEAVNEPATTTKTPKVAGMRGNFIGEAPFLPMKRVERRLSLPVNPRRAVSGKDCRWRLGASVEPKLGKGFGRFEIFRSLTQMANLRRTGRRERSFVGLVSTVRLRVPNCFDLLWFR